MDTKALEKRLEHAPDCGSLLGDWTKPDLICNCGAIQASTELNALKAELAAAQADLESAEDCMNELHNWAMAFPFDMFPEPDFKKARELLKEGGMTVDAITASVTRHVIKRVDEIAKKWLSAHPKTKEES